MQPALIGISACLFLLSLNTRVCHIVCFSETNKYSQSVSLKGLVAVSGFPSGVSFNINVCYYV